MSQPKKHANRLLAFLSILIALAILGLLLYIRQTTAHHTRSIPATSSQVQSSSSEAHGSTSPSTSSSSSHVKPETKTDTTMSSLVDQYNNNQLTVGDTYQVTVTLSDQASWYPVSDDTYNIYVASENAQAPQGASFPVYASKALADQLQPMTTATVTFTVQEGIYSPGAPDLVVTAID